MKFISTSELNKLTKGATTEKLKDLITAGINEMIPMTELQILKLVKIKEGKL